MAHVPVMEFHSIQVSSYVMYHIKCSCTYTLYIVQAPQNFTVFSPTNISVMLEWTPPEPVNAMEHDIRLEQYELRYR